MPLPCFSDDDYLNYCVTEALMLRMRMEEIQAEKDRERSEWKNRPIGSGGAAKGAF
jgi:hypothetical protein